MNEDANRYLVDLRAERDRLREVVRRVEGLTYASDDGSEYEHDHGIGDGHDECPACWAEDIRLALKPSTDTGPAPAGAYSGAQGAGDGV